MLCSIFAKTLTSLIHHIYSSIPLLVQTYPAKIQAILKGNRQYNLDNQLLKFLLLDFGYIGYFLDDSLTD